MGPSQEIPLQMAHRRYLRSGPCLGTYYKECPICCGPLPSQSVGRRRKVGNASGGDPSKPTDDGRTDGRNGAISHGGRKEGENAALHLRAPPTFRCQKQIQAPGRSDVCLLGKATYVPQVVNLYSSSSSNQIEIARISAIPSLCRNHRCRLGIGDCA